jgi:very-short-patch-repair endonuclease
MKRKRTTPKVFRRAKQLRREITPTEIKLWKHLRAHRMNGVHFRPQHAIGNYIADFPWHRPPGRCVHRARN